MGKIKTFFRVFVKSLTRPAYYNDIAQARFSFSLKYLFFLLFLISLGSSVIFAFRVLSFQPKMPEFLDKAKSVVRDFYPKELVITHREGKISTNVKEPYFIDMPEAGREIDLGGMHLVAIDTKGNVEDYDKYNSGVLLTDRFAVVPDNENGQSGFRIYPLDDLLKDVPNGMEFNSTVYGAISSRILPYIDRFPFYLNIFAAIAIFLWPFFGAAFGLSGYLIYLIPFGFVIWIVAKIMKKSLPYGKVYQLSLHGLTLPILVFSLLSLFTFSVPFLFSLIFFVFMVFVLTKISSGQNSA